MRWCWVNFQCLGVLLISILVGQGPTVLAVFAGVFFFFWGGGGGGEGGGFSCVSFLSSFSLSLGGSPIQTEIVSEIIKNPEEICLENHTERMGEQKHICAQYNTLK